MNDLTKPDIAGAVPVAKLDALTALAPHLVPGTSVPANFRFGAVTSTLERNPIQLLNLAPSLGPLTAFVGDWQGHGFNTIFRPNSPQTPTTFPVTPTDPIKDNVLELNLTLETLSFAPSLGSVPNRGMVQADAFLNGVPYRQTISDVTPTHGVFDQASSVGIHVEPGLWMAVPPTTFPAEVASVSRMASIPHGTTINAQGTSVTFAGKPDIPAVDITPNIIGGGKFKFPSQTATNKTTFRIPQDLGPWMADNTITQAMLDDPNSLLRNVIAGQTILKTTQISITTNPKGPILVAKPPHTPPAPPAFGGGTDNIAFLDGDAAAAKPNAQAFQMDAIFWIETVQHTLHIPIFKPGHPPLELSETVPSSAGNAARTFMVVPPHEIASPRTITFTTTQIQYSQLVILNFNGLAWPHVSVATLLPAGPHLVPASAWT